MINIQNEKDCCGCHACYNICPKNAITMMKDKNGFKYPKTDNDKCINCGLCEKTCPMLKKNKINNKPKAFACINKKDEIRIESSSGGIFSLIAENILNQNGIVFGAMFDERFNVIHSYIEKTEDLYKLRGSKYVQSIIGDNYKKAKDFLENGNKVLFTGTPCQIEGLKLYLQKSYENLYTQDIICHGVPSPKVWETYNNIIKHKFNSKIKRMSFRNKENGWKKYSLKYEFYNDNSFSILNSESVYMKAFLKDLCLRSSCYNCNFKNIERNSDITLADFWGIQNILPEFDDDKGTSLVIINSEKGKEIFEEIKENIKYIETDINKAIKYNQSMLKSAKLPKNRKVFFENLEDMNFDELVKKYLPKTNIFKLVTIKTKKIIKKILKR